MEISYLISLLSVFTVDLSAKFRSVEILIKGKAEMKGQVKVGLIQSQYTYKMSVKTGILAVIIKHNPCLLVITILII